MTNKTLLILVLSSLSLNATASGMEDDPLIGKVMIDQFETRSTGGSDPLILEAQGWLGKDLHKLWIKTDVERVGGTNEELEIQALYSRAIAPYWDIQTGWRHDTKPAPNRDWLTVGLMGLSPYWFEVDAALFLGKNGRTAARLKAEYEMLFSQRLILTPEIEVNIYGKDDAVRVIGSGLSDAIVGLRLRYEIRREIAPYVGINWTGTFDKTADFTKAAGDGTSDVQLVVGLRSWF